jgi:hypothetical protein
MVAKYKLLQDRFEHTAGTIVYECGFYDYGLSSDDSRVTGIPHQSVTLSPTGDYPFFTVPQQYLEEI